MSTTESTITVPVRADRSTFDAFISQAPLDLLLREIAERTVGIPTDDDGDSSLPIASVAAIGLTVSAGTDEATGVCHGSRIDAFLAEVKEFAEGWIDAE